MILTWPRMFLSNLDGSNFFFDVVFPKPDMPMAANTSMSAIVTAWVVETGPTRGKSDDKCCAYGSEICRRHRITHSYWQLSNQVHLLFVAQRPCIQARELNIMLFDASTAPQLKPWLVRTLEPMYAFTPPSIIYRAICNRLFSYITDAMQSLGLLLTIFLLC